MKYYDLQTVKKMDNMVIRAIKRRRPIKAEKYSGEDTLEIVECLNNISATLRGSGFKGLLKMFQYPNSSLKKYVLWEVLCRVRGRR